MDKKKPSKHILFYTHHQKVMPSIGLCSCAFYDYIDWNLLQLFTPTEITNGGRFWASGKKYSACAYQFTPLRQTIVLFMAALNNEL